MDILLSSLRLIFYCKIKSCADNPIFVFRAKSVASSVTSNLTRSASFHGGYAAKAALTRAPVISDDDDSLSGEWSPILAAAIQSSSFLQIKSQYEQLKSSQGYSTLPANNAGHGSHGSQDAQNSNYDTEYVDCNSYLKYVCSCTSSGF